MDTKSKAHLETLNREMGEVKTELTWLKNEIQECKDRITSVDSRTWYILGSVVLSILVQIFFKLWVV